MTVMDPVQAYIERVLTPKPGGLVGLAQQLLEGVPGLEIEFERVGESCVCRWFADGVRQETTVPIPAKGFRAILAHVATLCNQELPNSATPYQGECELTAFGEPGSILQVSFINTPEKQQLNLHRSFLAVPPVSSRSIPTQATSSV